MNPVSQVGGGGEEMTTQTGANTEVVVEKLG
jgi:hypothetical protein